MARTLISRKSALDEIKNTMDTFRYKINRINDDGMTKSFYQTQFIDEGKRLVDNFYTETFTETLNELDSKGFKQFYELVGNFASRYEIGNKNFYKKYEPVCIENLEE